MSKKTTTTYKKGTPPSKRMRRVQADTRTITASMVCVVVAVLVVVLLSVLPGHIHHKQKLPVHRHSTLWYDIADILPQHSTTTLVADQSDLAALRSAIGHKEATLALDACPSTNDEVVQKLQKRSFAALLQISTTSGSGQCTIAQVVQAYGRPNASITVAGTLASPKEVLLFYDKGPEASGPLKPISPPTAPATVVPTLLSNLPHPSCAAKTILTIVAHQDDDLLFMNPDHIHDIQTGDCMRTIYLTAGDAGLSSAYWLSRERGAEVAYDAMIGKGPSLWIERIVEVDSNQYIRIDSPRGNPNISLIFVRLPDGNLNGNGFWRTRYESLQRLLSGSISTMTSVDGQSSYSKTDVVDMLADLMVYFEPNEIDTQTPVNQSAISPDHSDHIATGQFAMSAYTDYSQSQPLAHVPIVYYTGYPIEQMPVNVSDTDLTEKSDVFYAYAVHDRDVCDTPASCAGSPYSQWLQREYTYTP